MYVSIISFIIIFIIVSDFETSISYLGTTISYFGTTTVPFWGTKHGTIYFRKIYLLLTFAML